MRNLQALALVSATAFLLHIDVAGAQVSPAGPQFRVNQFTPGTQFAHPQTSVATTLGGSFIVVWSSEGQDGSGSGVYGRLYDSMGQAQNNEFQVNTYTTGNQGSTDPHPRSPAVSGSDQGFVIVWEGQGAGGTTGIFAKLYDPQGAATTSDLHLGGAVFGERPSVGMAADGSFVAVWHGNQGSDSSAAVGRLFDATGSPAGLEFRANSTTSGRQDAPRIGVAPSGDFVVAWRSSDGSDYGAFAQRFDSSGSTAGTEFKVNSHTPNGQWYPVVAMDSQGFIVSWQSFGQDGSSWALVAKMYDSAGDEVAPEFLVNTYTTGAQAAAALALDPAGFVIIWDDTEQDGDGHGIVGRRYARNGVPVSGEFQVNTTTNGTQRDPSVASDANGRFIVVWPSFTGAVERDTYAQRFVVSVTTTTTTTTTTVPVCGNGVREGSEQCDDGNTSGGDGCSDVCQCESSADLDGDGLPDLCDDCPNDPDNDADEDGQCGDVDPCPADPADDADGDGFCADVDNCPVAANPSQSDADGDGVGDACDGCANADDAADPDEDGLPNGCDPCNNVGGAQDMDIKARILIRFMGASSGNDRVQFSGEFVLPSATTFGMIDPLAMPVRIRLETSAGAEIFDLEVPTSAFSGAGTAGWTLNGKGTKWSFKNKTASPEDGIVSIGLDDRSFKSPRQVRVRLQGRNSTYLTPFEVDPIRMIVSLGDSIAGRCGETHFAHAQCEYLKGHASLLCQR